MILPVFPTDIERHSGLKKAARVLFKTWPGLKPIHHSQALNILAKGLGYQSYHHAKELSSSWPDARPGIEINAVEWNISEAMTAELQAPGNPKVGINLGNLLAYIQTLPLHHLRIFKIYPELLDGRNSFPLHPHDPQSPFGKFQYSPVFPLEDGWQIFDNDDIDQ